MFKIVKSATLAALQAQAATAEEQATSARRDAEAARADADKARAEASRAQADLQFVVNDKTVKLAELRAAAQDPVRGPSVRGMVAVTVLRDLLKDAEAMAKETGREIDPGMRFVRVILGDEDNGTLPATGDAETVRDQATIAQGE